MHEHSNVTDKRTIETRWTHKWRDSEGRGRREGGERNSQFTRVEQRVGRVLFAVGVVVGRVLQCERQPIHNICAIPQGVQSKSARTQFDN